jgi:hypothetical protein
VKSARVRAQRSDSIRGEAAWIPHSFDELEELRRRLTDAGHPASVVHGVSGWLVAKALGEEDLTSGRTRSTYRRILEALGEAPTDREPVRMSTATRRSLAAHNHRSTRSVELDDAAA